MRKIVSPTEAKTGVLNVYVCVCVCVCVCIRLSERGEVCEEGGQVEGRGGGGGVKKGGMVVKLERRERVREGWQEDRGDRLV